MITEAVRRIIVPVATVSARMVAAFRAVQTVAGIFTIAIVLKRELAGRTINSGNLWVRKPLHRRLRQKREKSTGTMKNAG